MPSTHGDRRRRTRQKKEPNDRSLLSRGDLLKKQFSMSGEGFFAKLPAYIRYMIWEIFLEHENEIFIIKSRHYGAKSRTHIDAHGWQGIRLSKELDTLLRVSPLTYNDQRYMMPFYKANNFRFPSLDSLATYLSDIRVASCKLDAFKSLSVVCVSGPFSRELFDGADPSQVGNFVTNISVFSGLASLELEFDDKAFCLDGERVFTPKYFLQSLSTASNVSNLLGRCLETLPQLVDLRAAMCCGYSQSKFGIRINTGGCNYTGMDRWISEALSEDRHEEYRKIVEQYRRVWHLIRRKIWEQAGYVRIGEDERDKLFEIRMNSITDKMMLDDSRIYGWGPVDEVSQ